MRSRSPELAASHHQLEEAHRTALAAMREVLGDTRPTPPRGTVLVVDDEPALRRTVAIALARTGFTVLEAQDGIAAVEIFGRCGAEIRCVLCDLAMPRMNGWETLLALRKLRPGIPVILSSSDSQAQALAGHHPELPQAYLKKPYEIKTLYAVLNQVLADSPDSTR